MVLVLRMPSSAVEDGAGEGALVVTQGNGDGFAGEVARVGGLGRPAVALEGIGVHVLPADLPLVGQDLGHPELHPETAVDLLQERGGKGPVPPRALEARGTRDIDSTPQATAMS